MVNVVSLLFVSPHLSNCKMSLLNMSRISSTVMKQRDHLTTTNWISLLWYGYEVWIRHDRPRLCKDKWIKVHSETHMDTHSHSASSVFCSWRQSSALTPEHHHSPSTYLLCTEASITHIHTMHIHTLTYSLIRSWIEVLLLPSKSPRSHSCWRSREKKQSDIWQSYSSC